MGSAEECATQERQELNPNEPSFCSPSSLGHCPPGRLGYQCRLFICALTYDGTKGRGGSGSPLDGGRRAERRVPSQHEATRGIPAPPSPKSKSRGCAATAENRSSQRGVVNVSRHLPQQPLQLHLLHCARQMPSRLHQVLQPQLSRLPVRPCCLSVWPCSTGHCNAATQLVAGAQNHCQRPAPTTTRSLHHHDTYAHPPADPAGTASSRR